MKVLVACEFSGRVRDAFRANGHDAWSCDLEPTEGDPTFHLQRDALKVSRWLDWDLMVAFPPCTYLTKSNAWRWAQIQQERERALEFVMDLMFAPIPSIAIENPAGAIGTQIRLADQYIQPWHWGEPYQKTTGLWLKNLPRLVPAFTEKPTDLRAYVDNRPRTSGSLSGAGGVRRSRDRSLTFQCIAKAMADQWGPPSAIVKA